MAKKKNAYFKFINIKILCSGTVNYLGTVKIRIDSKNVKCIDRRFYVDWM